ncbi:DUF2972 domain-containing protein, partial [Campylobacter jejuni]|nr:DUF2972 domain-containing protein [Campylobacter jejuni]EIC9183424.1 DUF2972 domain-containing protein [Campylobacter jejuni]
LIPYIEKQKDIEEKKKIHERDILEFFNKNKILCAKFKNILDIHLSYIKLNRPDIVSSWNYYQEFEKIYKRLHT